MFLHRKLNLFIYICQIAIFILHPFPLAGKQSHKLIITIHFFCLLWGPIYCCKITPISSIPKVCSFSLNNLFPHDKSRKFGIRQVLCVGTIFAAALWILSSFLKSFLTLEDQITAAYSDLCLLRKFSKILKFSQEPPEALRERKVVIQDACHCYKYFI